jgi:hypothetical protein
MAKKPTPRWVVYLSIAVVGIALLIEIGPIVFMTMHGDKIHEVSGRAHIPADAVSHVPLPALVCSGHGGPLDSSWVFGRPIGDEFVRPAQPASVFCRRPEQVQTIEFREPLFYGDEPPHVYVWLETHEELASLCENALTAMITVDRSQLKGDPCSPKPDPAGSIGYAVVFSKSWGLDIAVKANAPFPR